LYSAVLIPACRDRKVHNLVKSLTKKTLNGQTKAALEAAVCPQCGKVSFYLPEEQLAKLVG
jgi:uncharacterized OB-fold protein